jgi:MSHA biogenesis protein MshQ
VTSVTTCTNNTIAAASYTTGVGSTTAITCAFPAKETALQTITLRAIDADSVSSAGHTEGTMEIRSGRVHIFNAYGSELVDLSMPMRVEYYSAADGWVTNTADTCTSVPESTLSLTNGSTPPPVTPPALIAVGTKTTTATASLFTSGAASLSFIAPDVGGEGYVDVSANLSTKTWLRFDWDGSGSDDDPTGKATFGIYKGNPRHIYLRERY